jgi:Tat protein translocase TatB subunit
MFGIGPEELALVALLALLVLGPERLPKVMRDMGKFVGDLRRTSDELRSEFLNSDKYLDRPSAAPAVVPEAPPASATGTGTSAGPPGESAFDREMREARERLRET